MSTIRVSKTTDYSCINNQPLRNNSLTWAARGLLAYLLSMPDDWITSTDYLVEQSPGGRDHVLRLLRELENHGYLSRTKKRDSKGKWIWEHVLREVPEIRAEIPDKTPQSDLPTTAKPAIYQVLNNQVLKESTPLPPAKPSANPNDLNQEPVPPFNGVEFKQALASFRRHRLDIKQPLTPEAIRLLYKKLGSWDEKVATEALEDAVLNRWRGVFEPRSHSPNGRYLPSQAEMNAGGRGKLVI